jgi:hypothetical protein
MKNSSDTIGNRTRDLPACCAVPERALAKTVVKSYLVASRVSPPARMEATEHQKYDWTGQDWGIMRTVHNLLVSCRLKLEISFFQAKGIHKTRSSNCSCTHLHCFPFFKK